MFTRAPTRTNSGAAPEEVVRLHSGLGVVADGNVGPNQFRFDTERDVTRRNPAPGAMPP